MLATAPAGAAAARRGDWPVVGHETPCVYPSDHISILDAFSRLVGRGFNCVMVYNDAAPTWAAWEDPWFIRHTYTDMQWGRWATQPGAHRQLVITQNLFPASENSSDWLARGAAGAFDRDARTLATNLVRAGLGHSIIRLAHEANGTWYPDSIPDTRTGDAEWVQFWRNTALAMRSVPGAHFRFDWTVNANTRDVPLSSFYPGDDVVDIIGVDLYDVGVPTAGNRWPVIAGRPDGLNAVSAFAAAHHKPLSIPEWGVGPALEPGKEEGGDDPSYVNGIAAAVQHDDVAYQSYFFADDQAIQLLNSPLSLAAYRGDFGPTGAAVAAAQREVAVPAPVTPPLTITSGPRNGSVIRTATTFTFTSSRRFQAQCSLDGAWKRCTSRSADVLSRLAPGFHIWEVKLVNAANQVAINGRTFLVSGPAALSTGL
ncbi:MAG TPA: glycosyl hydrolase [Solirubrobacteraceae bacterium]|nr:glycosyl hydrolase [Solirubrobacteraceae bacterium]